MISLYLRGIYIKKNTYFRLYLFSRWRNFSQHAYLGHYRDCLHAFKVWLRAVYKIRAPVLTANLSFLLYLGSHLRGFPEKLVSGTLLMFSTNSDCSSYRSLIKGPFHLISNPIQEIFLKIYISHTLHVCYKFCTFGCDQSVNRNTLHGEKFPFLPYFTCH